MLRYTILVFLLGFIFFSHNVLAQEEKFEKLIPTDDSHVLADLNDPEDLLGIKAINSGKADVLQLVSAWNITENQRVLVSLAYLKFDLSEYESENIKSAYLKLYAKEAFLPLGPKNVALIHVPNNDWNELQITYNQRPFFQTDEYSTISVSSPNTWYTWDVSEFFKDYKEDEISFALIFESASADNIEEYVSFDSKETSNSEFSPVLELTVTSPEFFSDIKPDNVSLYSGIAIAIGGILVGYLISKRKANHVKPKQIQRIICSGCNRSIPSTFQFCPACGTKIKIT